MKGVPAYPVSLEKFERSDLYGQKVRERRLDNGERLQLARLTWDGRHVIPDKGLSMIYLDEDKNYVPNADIYDVNKEGEPIPLTTSIFKTGVDLETTIPVDEFFQYNIENTYVLASEVELQPLKEACKALQDQGKFYTFKYAYYDSYYPSDAIIIPHEKDLVIAIGERFELVWVGPTTDIDALFKDIEEDEDEDISFEDVW